MAESKRSSEGQALFSSVEDALNFALNFEDLTIPGPVMNRAMAELSAVDKAKSEARARAYGVTAQRGGPVRTTPKSAPMGGRSDRAVVAGWILQRFLHLEVEQRLVLTLRKLRPRTACVCGSACCRGWTWKREWVEAVRILSEHIKEWAQVDLESGKRGYSTDPRLRVALIEDFAKPEDRRASLKGLAELAECTTVTAASHRARVHGYLERVENQAWEELAAIFDAHGITGVPPDA